MPVGCPLRIKPCFFTVRWHGFLFSMTHCLSSPSKLVKKHHSPQLLPFKANLSCPSLQMLAMLQMLLRDWLNSYRTSGHWWGGVTGRVGEVEATGGLRAAIRTWILSWLRGLTKLIMPAKGKHTSPATSRSLSPLHWFIFLLPRFLFYLLRAIKHAICSPENSKSIAKIWQDSPDKTKKN